jgi:hypothetical protein
MQHQINLQTERDIVKYFSMSNVAVRPEASALIHARIEKLGYIEHKRAYIDKMLRKIKEKQSLHSGGSSNVAGG